MMEEYEEKKDSILNRLEESLNRGYEKEYLVSLLEELDVHNKFMAKLTEELCSEYNDFVFWSALGITPDEWNEGIENHSL